MSGASEKKLVRIEVTSDTVCPWCFVGKKNLDKAIAASNNIYNFEVHTLLLFVHMRMKPNMSAFFIC